MKRQDLDNMAALDLFDRAMKEYEDMPFGDRQYVRLRYTQADVCETPNFYVLRSYWTFVAAIEKSTGYCADMLRKEYGYTATSAQHIAKFMSDYGDRSRLYRWR